MKEFNVKKEHLLLLNHLQITTYESVPSVDIKRPFGNSDILADIKNITGFILNDKQIDRLYAELKICLQILCRNLCIKEGKYTANDYRTDWKEV